MKLLQNVVNEAMTWLGRLPVTASAYSQARYKLKHTAFIELIILQRLPQALQPLLSY